MNCTSGLQLCGSCQPGVTLSERAAPTEAEIHFWDETRRSQKIGGMKLQDR
jgi:hypothetical protein